MRPQLLLLRSASLVILCLALLLSGCATIPESAYYHYAPDRAGRPPGTLSGKTEFQWHNLYSLGLVGPLTVRVEGVDGLRVKTDLIQLAPGQHTVVLTAEDPDNIWSCILPVDVKPGVEYCAKAGRYKGKNGPWFFIEERTTKKRVSEGPASQTGMKVRIYI